MQEKAAFQQARVATNMLQDENVKASQWASHSSYLNSKGNLWVIIGRRVFYGGRQFETIAVLKACIEEV